MYRCHVCCCYRNSHTHRLTLKLEILVDFPASANVLLTQFTMMPSALSPPPSSSSTFSVYLKEQGGGVHNEMIGGLQIIGMTLVIIYYWSRSSPSHQLPHQAQGQGWDAGVQVMSANAHNGEMCRFAQINGIVTVLQLVEGKRKAGGKRGQGHAFALGEEQV